MTEQDEDRIQEELQINLKVQEIEELEEQMQRATRKGYLPAVIALIWKKLDRLVVQQQDLRQQLSALQENWAAWPSTASTEQELLRQLEQTEEKIEQQDAKIEKAKKDGEPEDVNRYEGNRKRLVEKEEHLRQMLNAVQEKRATWSAHAIAQQEIKRLKEQLEQWEQRIVEQEEKIFDGIENDKPERVINSYNEVKDRLVKEKDDRWQQLCALQAQLASPASGAVENIMHVLVKRVEKRVTEIMEGKMSKLKGTCDTPDKLTRQGTKRQRESEEAAEGPNDQQDDDIDFESEEWQARENALHQNLVELLRHPSIYRGLGLSGPPHTIQHATLEERLNTMKVLL